MARYIKDFQTNVDPQAVHSAVNQYLQKEGYGMTEFGWVPMNCLRK